MISAEPLPGAPELARMGRGRVGTLRVNLAWGSVQSSPGAPYDWSHYDPVIAGAARNGIRVLATVYSSPTWAEPSPEYPPLGGRMAQFQDFVRAAVGRYGTGGTFWREHPDTPRLPVTDWQVWNEPNSPLFWKPRPDPAAYLELLRGFDSAARGADPQAEDRARRPLPHPARRNHDARLHDGAIPGPRPGPLRRRRDPPVRREPRKRARVDRSCRDVDGPLRRRRTAGIWISEVGWASGGRPSGLTVGPQGQADYLTRTFELAAAGPRAARARRA